MRAMRIVGTAIVRRLREEVWGGAIFFWRGPAYFLADGTLLALVVGSGAIYGRSKGFSFSSLSWASHMGRTGGLGFDQQLANQVGLSDLDFFGVGLLFCFGWGSPVYVHDDNSISSLWLFTS